MPSLLDWRRAAGIGAEPQRPTARSKRGKLHWLLVSTGWLLIVATAFMLGYLLAEHDAEGSLASIQALQTERDMLSEQAAALRDAQTKLERSHQMDVEGQRAAQAQILQLEEERMRLERQLTQLRALVGAGEHGVVEVDDLVVTPLDGGWYRYRLTLSQLVPDFGRSEGEVALSLVTESGDGRSLIPLAELVDDSAGKHRLSFEDFQVVEGRFRLGDDVEPVDLIVEILPKDDTLSASKLVVGWRAALAGQGTVPVPSMPAMPKEHPDGPIR